MPATASTWTSTRLTPALRRVAALVTLALALVALALPAGAARADSFEDSFVAQLNAARAGSGVPALGVAPDLTEIARAHSQVMASQNRLFHNPELTTQVTEWTRVAENVGYGPGVDVVHAALMNSAGHRANILDTKVTQVGVGVAWSGSRIWVTQVFRKPTANAPASLPAPAPAPAPAPVPVVPVTLPAVCGSPASAGFVDVPKGMWAAGAVDCAVEHGLARGLGSGFYGPERNVTRAELASFTARLLEATGRSLDGAPDRFTDDSGLPHEDAINGLAQLGIVGGVGGGRFDPQSPATRGEVAALLVRLHEHLAGTMPTGAIPFADLGGNVFADAINKAYTAGLTLGTSPSAFSPAGLVRRDQVAVFVVRELEELRSAGLV